MFLPIGDVFEAGGASPALKALLGSVSVDYSLVCDVKGGQGEMLRNNPR